MSNKFSVGVRLYCFIVTFIFLAILVIFYKYNGNVQYYAEQYVKRNTFTTGGGWRKAVRRPIPSSDAMNDRWIVITTINPPTNDVKKLAKIPGWKVVVVGDTKSPPDWKLQNCVFLDIAAQVQLGYKITKLLKYRSYTRKNIGYLYAIEHGAKIIYETDDDNSPTTGVIEFDQNSSKEYLVYDLPNENVVNPYSHFGQSSIWPRGYPLDMIGRKTRNVFQTCSNRRALVQQGVVNGDPDVDAIFRLTRKDKGVPLDVKFDPLAKQTMLPKGLIAPYNTQNTLHLYDAFWGLLIPQTVAFRACDIWRGYWAQRLLWDIDGYLSFFGPNAKQVRNSHSYLDDFIDERELYHEASDLVKFLVQWKSDKTSFYDRIIDLTNQMSHKKFWKHGDVILAQYWLEDLASVGYKPPVLKLSNNGLCNATKKEISPREQPSSYLLLGKKLKLITS